MSDNTAYDETARVVLEPLQASLRVVVIDGPDAGAVCVLGDGPLAIGSDPACDLALTDPAVSRQHVTLARTADDTGVIVSDRGSRNGTFLAGQRVADPVVARVGSVLRVGRSTLALLMDGMQPVEPGPPALGNMIGAGPAMKRLFSLVGRLAASDATVLVCGETGSGKEMVARTLHEQSRRAAGPFVVFDCAAVPETLIAGELFGHVRGSFTGATRDHAGAFERAHGGTLFIDEIGELSLDLQPKLLRALETRSVRRIGDKDEQQIDVRIIAATHRDLQAMVAERRFRGDLYYRLAVVTVTVPPLRERPDDVDALITRFSGVIDPPPPPAPADVIARLRAYPWPGNVRELRNLVERAAALGSWRDEVLAPLESTIAAQSPALAPTPTPPSVSAVPTEASTTGATGGALGFREAKEVAMAAFEREYLGELLAAHDGNISRAARAAGMDRSHLSSLIRKHRLRARADLD